MGLCFSIAVRVAKLKSRHFAAQHSCKHCCYGAGLGAACSHTHWQWLMAAVLQTLLLLPSRARFDLPCSRWRVLEAGALASGVAKVAPVVAARRHLQAAEGPEMGATAVRYFR